MYHIELQHNNAFHSILIVNDRAHFQDKRTAVKHANEWNEATYVRQYPLNECKAIVKEGLL